MRILFFLRSSLYLRHFKSTLRLLAARGHEVHLSYQMARDDEVPSNAEPLPEISDVRFVGLQPARDDEWSVLVSRLRGVVDYLRYLHPSFGEAVILRSRLESVLPFWLRGLRRMGAIRSERLHPLIKRLIALDEAVPASREVCRFIEESAPDVVLVSPLVSAASPQVEVVKACRELGIPCGLCVASWDNLTNKGLIRVQPDRVFVWNDCQRKEAETYHFVPPDRVRITGAQLFDRWFDRSPSHALDEFNARAGLPAGKRFLLFCGSSKFITGTDAEVRVVTRWLEALRRSGDEGVRTVPVLIRPHPQNSRHWADVDLSRYGDVRIWPKGRVDPADASHQSDYFDSLYHSLAVCGANTSALIEAAIVERPVLIIPSPELEHSQAGTLHFRYLLPEHGGFASVSRDLAEHTQQVVDALRDPAPATERARAFVEHFIRPRGLQTPCDPILVDEIEALARVEPTPHFKQRQMGLWVLARLTDALELRPVRRLRRRLLGLDKGAR